MKAVAASVLAAIVAIAWAGCDSAPSDPTVATGGVRAAATEVLLANGAANRPFTATLSGAAIYVVPAECPPDCKLFTVNTAATGEAAHLGRVEMQMSHRPYDFDDHQDGSLTLTAANGDKLYGVYDYDPSSQQLNPITVTGGTGRFADASGTILVAYQAVKQFKPMPPCVPATDPFGCLDPSVPWPWSATMTGTIGY